MRVRTYIYIILLTGYFIGSCKVHRTVKTPAAITSDTTHVKSPDSTRISREFVIQDSVEIGIYRIFPDTVTITGVGDIMLGTNYPDSGYLPEDSGKYLLSNVADILRSTNLTFGNLEGVLLDDGGTPKNCRNPQKCYLFRMPPYMAGNLHQAGFDVLSVANNHSGDFGPEGRRSTSRILDSLQIHYAGFDSKPYTIFKKDGIIYGFAAFAPNKGTASLNDLDSARKIILYLDSLADIVLVSFHGGAEGKDHQHVTRETETFYGENRGNVYVFAHTLIDSGADIIFGHGPHVVRAVEVYKSRFIAYSLGNFCTYKRFNLRGENAYAPIIRVYTDHTGKFLEGKIISAIQTGLGIPVIDPESRAIKKIIALTESDFPEAKIFIGDSGVITYIQK
ncbi:MAG: CapA family protein [Bacteroidetes bacterium]|nr:CapA family protein [Bacteroidota bacterium]MCH8231736.1 CapA family protein [Bacteroidota bacterium]